MRVCGVWVCVVGVYVCVVCVVCVGACVMCVVCVCVYNRALGTPELVYHGTRGVCVCL